MRHNTCIHYTGAQSDSCKAGVQYESLTGGKVSGWGLMLPCWTSTMKHASDVQKVKCEKYQAPTDAEIAQEKAESDAYMAKFMLVMPFVSEWRKKLPKGKSEVVVCPACSGRLKLSQSSYNHVWGACETEGCVRWME